MISLKNCIMTLMSDPSPTINSNKVTFAKSSCSFACRTHGFVFEFLIRVFFCPAARVFLMNIHTIVSSCETIVFISNSLASQSDTLSERMIALQTTKSSTSAPPYTKSFMLFSHEVSQPLVDENNILIFPLLVSQT